MASTSAALETSAVNAAALPPSPLMMPTVSSAAAPLRSTQNTAAPSRAKVAAVALPLPQPGPIEPAPTTIATLPLSRSITVSLKLLLLRSAEIQAAFRYGNKPSSVPTLGPQNRPVRGRFNGEDAHMPVTRTVRLCLAAALLGGSALFQPAFAKPFMIVGLDEKVWWDDDGKTILAAPGKDQVLIVDLANPETPKIVASLPLKNSIVGPPVNVDIDPSGSVALVADLIDNTKDGDALKQVPDNKIYVIDLKATPPKLAGTITGGKQPSGLSFSPDGRMALVANRADNSISVLSVDGTDVKITDTVSMPDSVSHVIFT